MTTKPRRQRIKNRAKARSSPEEEGVQSDKLDKVKNWHNVREEILSVLKRKQKIGATASSAIQVRFFVQCSSCTKVSSNVYRDNVYATVKIIVKTEMAKVKMWKNPPLVEFAIVRTIEKKFF